MKNLKELIGSILAVSMLLALVAVPAFVVNADEDEVVYTRPVNEMASTPMFDNRCDLVIDEVSATMQPSGFASMALFPIHPEFDIDERQHRYFEFDVEQSPDGTNWFFTTRIDTSFSQSAGTVIKKSTAVSITAPYYRLRVNRIPQDSNGNDLNDCLTVEEFMMSSPVLSF